MNKREQLITSILDGFQSLGLIYLPAFKIQCTGGACWSEDKIILEAKSRSKEYKERVEKNLEAILLKQLRQREEVDLLGSTGQHNILIYWVNDFSDYRNKYFSL